MSEQRVNKTETFKNTGTKEGALLRVFVFLTPSPRLSVTSSVTEVEYESCHLEQKFLLNHQSPAHRAIIKTQHKPPCPTAIWDTKSWWGALVHRDMTCAYLVFYMNHVVFWTLAMSAPHSDHRGCSIKDLKVTTLFYNMHLETSKGVWNTKMDTQSLNIRLLQFFFSGNN